MIIRCIKTESFFSPRNDIVGEFKSDLISRYKRLTINKTYEVFGVLHFGGSFSYLVFDDEKIPSWYYSEMFEIEDSKITRDWQYSFNGYGDNKINMVMGYDQLVNNLEHYEGVTGKESKHMELFKVYNDLK
jgi:hypothetical protein